MKKIYIGVSAFLLIAQLSLAQTNTFPSSGNVGIGTTTPSAHLDIFNNNSNSTNLSLSADYATSYRWRFNTVDRGNAIDMDITASNSGDSQQTILTMSPTWSGRPQLALEGNWLVANNGNIGIGTLSPANKLDVQGGNASVYNNGAATSFVVGSATSGKTCIAFNTSADASGYSAIQSISTYGSTYGNVSINAAGGNVLIGKSTQTNSAYILDVAGNVRANSVVINSTGADFVFEPTYKLRPLSDLKTYIDQNHHLPEIEPAKQMQTEGVNVGDNQTKLLQKIEELTLYLIEKDNENKVQIVINNKLQNDVDQLKQQVESLIKSSNKN